MELQLDPVSLLLGHPSGRTTNMYKKKLYNVLTLGARKILLHWILDKAPTIVGWHKIIMEYIPLDFLTCLWHFKFYVFNRTWKPFLDYVDVYVFFFIYFCLTPTAICLILRTFGFTCEFFYPLFLVFVLSCVFVVCV